MNENNFIIRNIDENIAEDEACYGATSRVFFFFVWKYLNVLTVFCFVCQVPQRVHLFVFCVLFAVQRFDLFAVLVQRFHLFMFFVWK